MKTTDFVIELKRLLENLQEGYIIHVSWKDITWNHARVMAHRINVKYKMKIAVTKRDDIEAYEFYNRKDRDQQLSSNKCIEGGTVHVLLQDCGH